MKLETVEFIMAVEDAFVIEIPDSRAETVVSLRQLGDVVEDELGRLNRPKDAAKVLKQIVAIAAYFGGFERAGVGPETKLAEISELE